MCNSNTDIVLNGHRKIMTESSCLDVFEVRNPLIVNWDPIRSKIKRMGVESFTRIGVSNSIEDWILDDVDGICSYLKMKQIPQ